MQCFAQCRVPPGTPARHTVPARRDPPPRPPVTCARPHPHGGARVPPELQPDRPPLVVGTLGRLTPFCASVPPRWASLEGALGESRRPGGRPPGRGPPGERGLPHAAGARA